VARAAPPPRNGHAMCAAGGRLLVFGGFDRQGTALENDLWVLEPTAARLEWREERLASSAGLLGTSVGCADAPAPRYGAGLCAVDGAPTEGNATRVLLVGGSDWAGALDDLVLAPLRVSFVPLYPSSKAETPSSAAPAPSTRRGPPHAGELRGQWEWTARSGWREVRPWGVSRRLEPGLAWANGKAYFFGGDVLPPPDPRRALRRPRVNAPRPCPVLSAPITREVEKRSAA
jgi:hypothetical protein